MPRQARLDAPGTLHHVIVRGIERGKIVNDKKDRPNFVSLMSKLASESRTIISARFLWGSCLPPFFKFPRKNRQIMTVKASRIYYLIVMYSTLNIDRKTEAQLFVIST